MSLVEKVKFRLSLYCDVIIAVVLVVTLLILRFTVFRGVPESAMDFITQQNTVPYTVTTFIEPQNSEDTYHVVMTSELADAPLLEITPTVVPADMAVDSQYLVDWVRVAGAYDTYVVTRDKLCVEYAGTISQSTILAMEKEVHNIMKSQLSTVVQPAFIPCIWIMFGFGVVLFSGVSWLVNKNGAKLVELSPWEILDERLNAVTGAIGDGSRLMDCNRHFRENISQIPYPAVNCRFWADDSDYRLYVARKQKLDEMRIQNAQYDTSAKGVKAQGTAVPLVGREIADFCINDPVRVSVPAVAENSTKLRQNAENPMASIKRTPPAMKQGTGLMKAGKGLKGKNMRPVVAQAVTMTSKNGSNADIGLNFSVADAKKYAKEHEVPLMSFGRKG